MHVGDYFGGENTIPESATQDRSCLNGYFAMNCNACASVSDDRNAAQKSKPHEKNWGRNIPLCFRQIFTKPIEGAITKQVLEANLCPKYLRDWSDVYFHDNICTKTIMSMTPHHVVYTCVHYSEYAISVYFMTLLEQRATFTLFGTGATVERLILRY